jgi:hypothetical protein
MVTCCATSASLSCRSNSAPRSEAGTVGLCAVLMRRGHAQRHRGQSGLTVDLGNKHIPTPYLRASTAQRRAFLSDLLDTESTVQRLGRARYDTTSRRLAADTCHLMCSLGYRANLRKGRAKLRGTDCGPTLTVTFTTRDEVFGLARKRCTHIARLPSTTDTRTRLWYVVGVRPFVSVAVRCGASSLAHERRHRRGR